MADYHFPEDVRYTKEDEWVRADGDTLLIGITDYAQQQLGDIVFLELPEPAAQVHAGESFGVIESVKAVSELFSPLSGTVVEANPALEETPELVNESCYEDGWILRITPDDSDDIESLLSLDDYRAYVTERAE